MSLSVSHRPDLFPDNMTGMVCLDLGGYDGDAAKSCLNRGAARAVCVDNAQWVQYGWNAPVRLDGVEYADMDLMAWQEPGDFTILANVLYHCPHPWRVLEHVRALTKPGGTLLLHTWIIPGGDDYWRIYAPGDGHPRSRTVVWRPMLPGLGKLVTNVGFTDVTIKDQSDEHVTMWCS